MRRINGWMLVLTMGVSGLVAAEERTPPAPPLPEPVPSAAADQQPQDETAEETDEEEMGEGETLASQVIPQLLRALFEGGESTVSIEAGGARIHVIIDEEQKEVVRDLIVRGQKLNFKPGAIRDTNGEISPPRVIEQVRRSLLSTRGWQSVTDPDIAVILNLTAEQREEIDALKAEYRDEMRQRRRELREKDVPLTERMTEMDNYRAHLEEEIEAVLTDDQRSLFEEIMARAQGNVPAAGAVETGEPEIELGSPAEVPKESPERE